MSAHTSNDQREDRATALMLAHTICAASEQEFRDLFFRLRRTKRLSATVHLFNKLLSCDESRRHALEALRRLGLEHAGKWPSAVRTALRGTAR